MDDIILRDDNMLPEKLGALDGIGVPPGSKLVKVPTVLYQIFYDYALGRGSTELKQAYIMRELVNWRKENYPDYGIVNFWDFSRMEADEINHRIGVIKHRSGALSLPGLTWRMYVLLAPGWEDLKRRTDTTGITHLINESDHYQIE